MIVYAFDVDHTLEVSGGPVTVASLEQVHEDGHTVGICGNYAVFVRAVPEWHRFINFLGPMNMPKEMFLVQIKTFVPAEDYIMVGNDLAIFGASDDKGAAGRGGWRFIREQHFADGQR